MISLCHVESCSFLNGLVRPPAVGLVEGISDVLEELSVYLHGGDRLPLKQSHRFHRPPLLVYQLGDLGIQLSLLFSRLLKFLRDLLPHHLLLPFVQFEPLRVQVELVPSVPDSLSLLQQILPECFNLGVLVHDGDLCEEELPRAVYQLVPTRAATLPLQVWQRALVHHGPALVHCLVLACAHVVAARLDHLSKLTDLLLKSLWVNFLNFSQLPYPLGN